MTASDAPVLVVTDGVNSFFPDRATIWRRRFTENLRAQLEQQVLPQYIASQRWYAAKGAPVASARIVEGAPQVAQQAQWLVMLVDVDSRTESARYFVPLSLMLREGTQPFNDRVQAAVVARVRQHERTGILADAFADDRYCRTLVEAIGRGDEQPLEHGRLRFTATRAYAELRGDAAADLTPAAPLAGSSNTVLQLGERLFLKCYRRLRPGVNPELEVGRFLTEVAHFPHIVPLAGAVEYIAADDTATTVMLLQGFVRNQGDLWTYTANYLGCFLEDRGTGAAPAPDAHAAYLKLMRTLGTRTAELHRAFATPTSDPAFAAEPINEGDLREWRDRVRAEGSATLELLTHTEEIPEASRRQAMELLQHGVVPGEEARSGSFAASGLKIRHHGDYHLGQILLQRNDVIIVDFEGEPARPLAERRRKSSPLRDVAGMLRSFAYARHAALKHRGGESVDESNRLDPLLAEWEHETRKAFLDAYDQSAREAGLYPSFAAIRPLIELFETEKALYELRYELRNRPDWLGIPLGCLQAAVGQRAAADYLAPT